MTDVILALLLFCLSVATHIFFCRLNAQPGLHAKAYLFITLAFGGIYGWGALILPHSHSSFPLAAGVIFVLLVPVYLCFYVLTQLVSPSKKILMTITRSKGASYTEIITGVEEEDFIRTRLDDLVQSGCVTVTEGRYALSTSGRKVARVLDLMQHVLGRDIGG